MALENFDKLEERINLLLDEYERLQAENRLLKQALESKNLEIEDVKDKLKRLDREKGIVREKVDGILSRLESLIQGA